MLVTLFDTETTALIENSARHMDKQPRVIELFALTLQQTDGLKCPMCHAMGRIIKCVGEKPNEETGEMVPVYESIYCPTCKGARWEIEPKFKEVDIWESLFHPGILISEKITQITTITNEMVAGKPAFSEKAPEIMSYFARAHRVVAHNVSYDCDMVDFELKRCNERLVWPEKICTVEQTEWIKGHRMSLTALHEHLFGEPFAGAHRAEPDVRATAKCYMELVRRNML